MATAFAGFSGGSVASGTTTYAGFFVVGVNDDGSNLFSGGSIYVPLTPSDTADSLREKAATLIREDAGNPALKVVFMDLPGRDQGY